jgi:5-methylthioribose kinase
MVALTTDLPGLLLEGGRIGPTCRLRRLEGGVSSLVVAVNEGNDEWLAKTPLDKMAVRDDWPVDRSRALREAEVLSLLDGSLGPLRVPRLRFVDRDRRVVGMELIAPPAVPWKDELLDGRVDLGTAAAIGTGMGVLHALSVPETLSGPEAIAVFENLRVDPYYRTAARRVPHLASALERLIADSTGAGVRPVLIHGDLNPKNVLVTAGRPVLLDWEIAHAGDPAFDLGMVSAHLLLKACRAGFGDTSAPLAAAVEAVWRAYEGPAPADLAIRHTGAIMVARLHGKSPVGYLDEPAARDRVMSVAGRALASPTPGLEELVGAVVSSLQTDRNCGSRPSRR